MYLYGQFCMEIVVAFCFSIHFLLHMADMEFESNILNRIKDWPLKVLLASARR